MPPAKRDIPEYRLRRHDNGTWHVHWADDRRSKTRSTGTKDETKAQRFLADFIFGRHELPEAQKEQSKRYHSMRAASGAPVLFDEAYESARRFAELPADSRGVLEFMIRGLGITPITIARETGLTPGRMTQYRQQHGEIPRDRHADMIHLAEVALEAQELALEEAGKPAGLMPASRRILRKLIGEGRKIIKAE